MRKKYIVNKRKFRRALVILNFVSIIVLVLSCGLIVRVVRAYQIDRLTYIAAASAAVAMTTANPESPAPTEVPYYLSNEWKPPEVTPPITVNFSEIAAESTNVVAWLYCAGTPINYPVVSCNDNNYFLTHDYTGEKNTSGAIFSDERNQDNLYGDNIIIYGHHMKDNSMFGSLMQYQKQTYMDEHKTLYLITPEGNFQITIFAAWFCDAELNNYPVRFSSENSKKQFYDKAVHASIANTYQEYYADKRIITLVTCSYSKYIENPHFQVNGWLTEIGDPLPND